MTNRKNFVVKNRFKTKAICGEINLPYGTKCDCEDNIISYKGSSLCYVSSQNAYDYFSCDDDGMGLKRGELVDSIIKLLSKQDKENQSRWNKIWSDESVRKFKREDSEDHWIWNFNFYNADIEELEHIYSIIK